MTKKQKLNEQSIVREIAEKEFPELKPKLEGINFQTILNNMITKQGYELKTEIKNPKQIARLKILSISYDNANLNEPSITLEKFIEWYLIYMISKDRGSRKELRDILSAMVKSKYQQETTMGEKLRTNLT